MMPVRPGDVLRIEGEVAELIPSRSKPQGIAKIKWTAYNQRGERFTLTDRYRTPPSHLILAVSTIVSPTHGAVATAICYCQNP